MKKGLRARPGAAARPPPIRRRAQSTASRPESDRRGSRKKAQPPVKIESRTHLQYLRHPDSWSSITSSRFASSHRQRRRCSRSTAADLGRPLSEVQRRFADDDLLLDLQTVIATGVSLWREVETDNGAWYNRRLLAVPHREHNEIQGAVVTFADISEMKSVERESEAARNYSSSIVDAIRLPLVVLDHELRIISASPSFYRGFAVMPEEAVGRHITEFRDAVSTFKRFAASSTGSPRAIRWRRITKSRSSCRRAASACCC